MYLNCHTYYSLRYGTLSTAKLVRYAQKLGLSTIALTDINNTSAAFEFVQLCKEAGIRPLLGIDFRESGKQLYVGIAKNREGFYELNKLLTDASLSGKTLPEVPPPLANALIIYPRLIKPITDFKANEYLGIRPEHIHRLYGHELLKHQEKLLVLSPITYVTDSDYELHRLLQAIDQNVLLTKLDKKRMAKKTDRLTPPETLIRFYEKYPRIWKNTEALIGACQIDLQQSLKHNRQAFTGSKASDFILLEKLAMKGCKDKYGTQHQIALKRVEKELKVIRQQDFCAYFLITWDMVRYAASMGYHHVGRGSGANSIVAYCLRITDVDPLELDLYFERFINPYRVSPPDFDIDFSWDERDDVIDYIIKRYGQEYVALLATYSHFKGRAVIRELGKVFGLPKAEIDKIVADPQSDDLHPLSKEIFKYGPMLEGFPNHLSIHAGGMLISQRPLNYYTPLQLMPKGFPITHFDMHHAEDWGFHKYDVLSQRGLGHIKDAVDLIKKNQGRAVDVHDVEGIKRDEKVKALLRVGQCMGCFYIESPAMRGLLRKLACDNYLHLVAASSIIRPGVAKSGMMRAYIERFHRPHSFEYLHGVFKEHLGETFGIMVYQEDVMKIMHHFAGLDLDESDVLRRIMTGKKFKNDNFERLRQKYFDNCTKRGYSQQLTDEVWRQITSFAGYSFCKAHSASFAVESFQSLYLKAYFPLEFMVAVINNFGGFYQTEYYFHEARMSGATINAPCINQSTYLTTIKGKDIYIGFIHLHQMEKQVAHQIVYQRVVGGAFRNLEDFVGRVDISADQLEILIRIGAFRFTGKNKYELMWEKNAAFNPNHRFEASLSLFDDQVEAFRLPNLKEGQYDQAFDEIELLGFPLCSPFELLAEQGAYDCIDVTFFEARVLHHVRILGYYVCKKDVRASNGKMMAFGTWIDRKGQFFDTTHFATALKQFPFKGKGIYQIEGRLVEEFGFQSIEVARMERLAFVGDERY